eukprot:10130043-Lingulodinium_polyedra.AAC.1
MACPAAASLTRSKLQRHLSRLVRTVKVQASPAFQPPRPRTPIFRKFGQDVRPCDHRLKPERFIHS